MKRGRPSMMTPARKQRLLDCFRLPFTQADCALLAGIAPRTLEKWLTRGRRATKGEYADFVRDVEHAIAEGKASLVKYVMNAAPRKPELALKVLARRWPHEWGPAAAQLQAEAPQPLDMAAIRAKIAAKLDELEAREKMAADLARQIGAPGPDLHRIADRFSQP
jgi:hypothetical protein